MKRTIPGLLLSGAVFSAQADALEEQFSRVSELFLPAQIYACKLHYADMQPHADEMLGMLGYERRSDEASVLKRDTIKACLGRQATLTHDDCNLLFKSLYRVIENKLGSPQGDEAARRYIALSERVLPQLDAVMDACPEAKARFPQR